MKGATFLSAMISEKPEEHGGKKLQCTLQFGSASIEPRSLPLWARWTVGFHAIYTRILLAYTMDNFVNSYIYHRRSESELSHLSDR